MLIGTNLIQTAGKPVKQYEQPWFEYDASDALKDYGKTTKTEDGKRVDVTLDGKVWVGKTPVTIKFSDRKFASDEAKDAWITKQIEEALDKLRSYDPSKDERYFMLELLTKGMDLHQRVSTKDPLTEAELQARFMADQKRAGRSEKVALKLWEKQKAFLAELEAEEEEVTA